MTTFSLLLIVLLGFSAAVFPPGPPSEDYDFYRVEEEDLDFYHDSVIGLDNVDNYYYSPELQAIVPNRPESPEGASERSSPVRLGIFPNSFDLSLNLFFAFLA